MLTTEIDPKVVKEHVAAQFVAHGYCRENRHGDVVDDDPPMRARVYELVKRKVARSREEIEKHSLTNGELYALAFPEAPGTRPSTMSTLSDLDLAIRRALMRKVWGLTQSRHTGYVQRSLGAEGLGFVLCRTTSFRGLDPVEVCFVTDDADLIMSESVLPQIETLIRKADDLRLHAEMVMERRPELGQRIARELGLGVRRVEAALPQNAGNGASSAEDQD